MYIRTTAVADIRIIPPGSGGTFNTFAGPLCIRVIYKLPLKTRRTQQRQTHCTPKKQQTKLGKHRIRTRATPPKRGQKPEVSREQAFGNRAASPSPRRRQNLCRGNGSIDGRLVKKAVGRSRGPVGLQVGSDPRRRCLRSERNARQKLL